MLDVLYSEFYRLWDDWKSEADQAEFAVGLIRRALLKFSMKWDIYKNHYDFDSAVADELYRNFADLFVDIYVDVSEILPSVIGSELFRLSIHMVDAANEQKSGLSKDDVLKRYDECESKAQEFYSKLVGLSENFDLRIGELSSVAFE
jgi:hypothetical protein